MKVQKTDVLISSNSAYRNFTKISEKEAENLIQRYGLNEAHSLPTNGTLTIVAISPDLEDKSYFTVKDAKRAIFYSQSPEYLCSSGYALLKIENETGVQYYQIGDEPQGVYVGPGDLSRIAKAIDEDEELKEEFGLDTKGLVASIAALKADRIVILLTM